MGLFTVFVLAGSAAVGFIVKCRKPITPSLLTVLTQHDPTPTTLPPPARPLASAGVGGYLQQMADDLWGKQRRRQLQSISSPLEQAEMSAAERQYNRDLAIALSALGFSIGGALLTPLLGVLSLPGILYGSRLAFRNSYTALVKERRVTVDLLNAVIITLLLGGGHYLLCNLPIVLTALRRKLVNKIKHESRGALVDVFRQQPRYATVLRDGLTLEIPYTHLHQGHIVLVNAGETIPVDGTIVAGSAVVDQHLLTGEAQPVEKGEGDAVFALTVLLAGQVQIQLEKTGKATTAAQIGETLNQTVDFKTATHLWAEQTVDRAIVPTLLIGALTFPLIGIAGLTAILNTPPVHIITISSAICMLSYLNLAAKQGMLIKDGRILELLTGVDTVVFDKTGTLTEEQPQVGRIYTFNDMTEAELLGYTAAAERHQSHPIARAIRHEAATRGLTVPSLAEAETKVGYGVAVRINGHAVQVGSLRFMATLSLAIPPAVNSVQTFCHQQGSSPIFVAIDGKVVGAIELRPTIRPEAQAIIQQLRQRNLKLYIISGDHEAPTRQLAQALGIDQYYAEVLPADKAALIDQLQQAGRSVCFVGDGINDAIALKTAHVSISLKGASSVAVDTAQVILMDQSLTQLGQLFDLAYGYKRKMRSTFGLIVTPAVIAFTGALFLHFGFVTCILLNQVGFLTSIANTLTPLFPAKKKALGDQRASPPRRQAVTPTLTHSIKFIDSFSSAAPDCSVQELLRNARIPAQPIPSSGGAIFPLEPLYLTERSKPL
jgi:Cu2+-exporting ATPase